MREADFRKRAEPRSHLLVAAMLRDRETCMLRRPGRPPRVLAIVEDSEGKLIASCCARAVRRAWDDVAQVVGLARVAGDNTGAVRGANDWADSAISTQAPRSGGMGVVFEAVDPRAACGRSESDGAASPSVECRQRLLREARARRDSAWCHRRFQVGEDRIPRFWRCSSCTGNLWRRVCAARAACRSARPFGLRASRPQGLPLLTTTA